MDELFSATIANKNLRHTRRLREVLRAREITYSYLEGINEYRETSDSLERYWMEWGILANMERRAKWSAGAKTLTPSIKIAGEVEAQLV